MEGPFYTERYRIEVACLLHTLLIIYQTTLRHISEDSNLCQCHSVNKSFSQPLKQAVAPCTGASGKTMRDESLACAA